jgi:ribosomal protein S12 methylthiotransferase accessory factor
MNHPLEVWIRTQEGLSASIPILGYEGSRRLAMSIASQYLVRWIAGNTFKSQERSLVTFDMRTFCATVHGVNSRPQCPSCGNAELFGKQVGTTFELSSRPVCFSQGGYRIASPESVLKRCEHLVDCVTGPIVSLESVRDRDNPLLTVVSGAYFAPPSEARPTVEQLARYSLGKGRTRTQAMVSALGEAIERYSAAVQGDEPRVFARASELVDSVEPRELLLVSDVQYLTRDRANRHARSRAERIPTLYPREQPLHWTQVWSLTRPGQRRYVPSSMCFVGIPEIEESDAFPYDSNGDAAGSCVEEAVLQGLFEVVERDAVGIWWYNRLLRPAVDVEVFDDEFLSGLLRYYNKMGIDVSLLDVTTDLGIPTFVAYGETRETGRFSIGCGCHLDPRLAAERALTEFNQLYDPTGKHPLPWEPKEHSCRLFLQPDPLSSPVKYPRVETPEDIRTVVLSVVEKLERAGLEVLVLNRTRPDLELSVVRVIVPGLRHFWRRLAPGRLYTVPVTMGWRHQAQVESELNPVPLRL